MLWQRTESATWVPEAGRLKLGSYPGQRMLSPERLALPDYEYLGRSFFSFGEGKKCRRIKPGFEKRQGRCLSENGLGWNGEGRGEGRVIGPEL